MQKNIVLRLLPSQAATASLISEHIAAAEGVTPSAVSGFHILKRSVDARGRQAWIMLTVNAFINEPFQQRPVPVFHFKSVEHAQKKVIIIGAGPAGLFAALQLIEKGIRPIILERGKDVRARRRDLAVLNKEGVINPESNYCFGEGGAGTYSDGKLYTRSNKRGNISRILSLFVHFGAEENILYDAHPHIGTNKLPHIIAAMRHTIRDCGGIFLFEKKVTDFIIDRNILKAVKTADENVFKADAFILATGHSARDIYRLLDQKKISIELKPFALGIRIEHPQQLIDQIQYHSFPGTASGHSSSVNLPPASYSLVTQANQRGVFSFCMCPGGIIAPAATGAGELVVNGWSPSKRNNPYANSGIVVTVEEKDVQAFRNHGALAAMYFQESIERKAYNAGGGKFAAPAQRMVDFAENNASSTLPRCSYLPGVTATSLEAVFPSFIYRTLQEGLIAFGKKMKGYYSNEAIVVATESRTSSPVRIPRDKVSLHHPQIHNLYPCAEGAGFAGGIVSAAMDGEKIADIISEKWKM
ncbi:FAD-dependent protein [Agriterribacter sp.]|uniref:NAD(P)/FAD-dependent oxidoreductase n=1 Tax=Agriterribacter sp. TaxID=2821509 RepID=UPI002CA54621|nr:NAD(P)/FAD-dependent oxidoreductase [Agriterribacter sp.]HRO46825.1 NAD(P)/FAD-dependent oxidoreductase [Agriterribacter sp.]HRQ15566.1 NAD(P)/FAD-dependent oxidoreductase [Agriterribacter sp.]